MLGKGKKAKEAEGKRGLPAILISYLVLLKLTANDMMLRGEGRRVGDEFFSSLVIQLNQTRIQDCNCCINVK